MKANEAPEKIYRTTTYLDNDKGKTLWKKAPVPGAENIEYTRTDVFIEKACAWLEPTLTEYAGFYVGSDILEYFKKYMEGE